LDEIDMACSYYNWGGGVTSFRFTLICKNQKPILQRDLRYIYSPYDGDTV